MELGAHFSPWLWMLTALIVFATLCIGISKGLFSFPLVGDYISITQGPRDFIVNRLARYGDPFVVSLMGKKHYVVNSPDAIKYVLLTAHSHFKISYVKQVSELLGEGKFVDSRHPQFRRLLVSAASGEGLQGMLPYIFALAGKTVKSWENLDEVNTMESLRNFAFQVAMHIIWSDVDPDSEEMLQIRTELTGVAKGLNVAPINLPGFYYHKALQIKKVLASRMKAHIAKRRETGKEVKDMMNSLMTMEIEVSDHDICCLMMSTMFASFATTAAFIPWVLRYLNDFPEVRELVREEQDFLKEKFAEDKTLSWFKCKGSMPYTLQVVYEILRIEALVPFVPRRANKDIEVKGYTIPKGAGVWASFASMQYNTDSFPNPKEFNPERFEGKSIPRGFMPFGHGPHLCPGNDLAITEAMFIVHHLLTNYTYERVGPDQGVIPFPIRKPAGQYPIHLTKRILT